jgi:hypothetical protein
MLFQNYPTTNILTITLQCCTDKKAHVSEVKWPELLQIKFKAKVPLAAVAMNEEKIKIPSLWNVFPRPAALALYNLHEPQLITAQHQY